MLAPLRRRNFRLLFFGRVVSIAGSAMAPVALAFAVLELDGSATDLGFVLALAILPQIFFLLVGGVIADRLPRHLVMVGSNLVAGAAQAVAAYLLLTGRAEIWHLAVIALVRAVASSFFFPASQGIVPQTVPTEKLQPANALLRLALNATNIGGAALGGLLVAAAGPGWAIGFDALTLPRGCGDPAADADPPSAARGGRELRPRAAGRLARVPLPDLDLGRRARIRICERSRVGRGSTSSARSWRRSRSAAPRSGASFSQPRGRGS